MIKVLLAVFVLAGTCFMCQKKVVKVDQVVQVQKRGPLFKTANKVDAPVEEMVADAPKNPEYLPIYFDYDKAELTAEAKQTLSNMSTHFKGTMLISGCCDERGSDAYNDALGQRRAEAAGKWLADHTDGFEIKMESFGKRRLFKESCRDEACHAQNRRAEFKIIQ